jgi:hypothetical protein
MRWPAWSRERRGSVEEFGETQFCCLGREPGEIPELLRVWESHLGCINLHRHGRWFE